MYDSIQNIYVKYACVEFLYACICIHEKNAKEHYGHSFHFSLVALQQFYSVLLFTLLISISHFFKNGHVLHIYYIFKWIKYNLKSLSYFWLTSRLPQWHTYSLM